MDNIVNEGGGLVAPAFITRYLGSFKIVQSLDIVIKVHLLGAALVLIITL
jgi:hypothetical protein